jgi:hypothetical protein
LWLNPSIVSRSSSTSNSPGGSGGISATTKRQDDAARSLGERADLRRTHEALLFDELTGP